MLYTIREMDSLLIIMLEVGIFWISCRPICKGGKGCVFIESGQIYWDMA